MAADAKLLLETLLRANNSTALHLLLEGTDYTQSLRIKSVAREWIAKINTLLNSTKDRWIGVCLLAHLLKQCDTEIFLENCLSWLKTLTRILQQEKQNDNLSKYIAETVERMLSFSTEFSELSREISSSVVPSLLTTIMNEKNNLYSEVSLQIIKSCVQYYPGPSGSFWKRIETLVLRVFNRNNISLNQVACSCFAMLPKCGSSTGTGVDKQCASWGLQWRKITNTISNIINNLYTNYEAERLPKDDSTVLDLDPIPVIEPQRTESCVLRIKFLFKCLTLMLRNGFSKSINVPVNATVKLVQRILAINETSIVSHAAIESVLLKSSLPTIHISVLDFLKTFIESCQMSLLPHHQILMKIFLVELSWSTSDTNVSGLQKMFGKLRSAVYECLQLWIHITGSLGEQNDTVKKIVGHLINDIKPQVTTTKLLAPASSLPKNVHAKKARKRRVQDDVNQLTRPQQKLDHFANVELCISGLKALRAIVSKTSCDLPPQTLKEIQLFVAKLLLECQGVLTSTTHFNFPIPYESTECRKLLYHLLQSLLYNHNPSTPPPVQHAMQIFSRGIQDQCVEVSQFCAEAQMVCNILIHPRVAVLTKPVSLVQQEEVVNEQRNVRVSINEKQKTDEVNYLSVPETGSTGKSSQRNKEHCINETLKDTDAVSKGDSLLDETSDAILQNKGAQNSNEMLVDDGSERSQCSNITSSALVGKEEHSERFDNAERTWSVDTNLQSTTSSKISSYEKADKTTGEETGGDLLLGTVQSSHPENNGVDDNEHYPPLKKRKTSDINSNNTERPDILNVGGTMETNEDEELAKEMIASFVDSVPDSD